jgi:hypothetical protein
VIGEAITGAGSHRLITNMGCGASKSVSPPSAYTAKENVLDPRESLTPKANTGEEAPAATSVAPAPVEDASDAGSSVSSDHPPRSSVCSPVSAPSHAGSSPSPEQDVQALTVVKLANENTDFGQRIERVTVQLKKGRFKSTKGVIARGYGIQFSKSPLGAEVVETYNPGPAHSSKLIVGGDILTEIDGKSVHGHDLERINQELEVLEACCLTFIKGPSYFDKDMMTGYGIRLKFGDDGPEVSEVGESGPAVRSGRVKLGMVLKEINGKRTEDMFFFEICEDLLAKKVSNFTFSRIHRSPPVNDWIEILTRPFLLLNLFGEMIYIIEQRLIAQEVSFEKSCKVLVDLSKTMLKKENVNEMFDPKTTGNSDIKSIKDLFYTVVHSSIMRLSEEGFSKLFDCCIGAFKHQVVNCILASELIDITLNHLSVLEQIFPEEERSLVGDVVGMMHITYGQMPAGMLVLLRHAVLRHLQDHRVKVTPFLKSGLQNNDGSFVVMTSSLVPPDFSTPGEVRYQSSEGVDQSKHCVITLTESCRRTAPNKKTSLGSNIWHSVTSTTTNKLYSHTILDGAAVQQDVLEEQMLKSASPNITKRDSRDAKTMLKPVLGRKASQDAKAMFNELDILGAGCLASEGGEDGSSGSKEEEEDEGEGVQAAQGYKASEYANLQVQHLNPKP